MRWVLYFLGANKRLVTLCIACGLSLSLFLMGDGQKEHVARTVTTAVFNTGRITFSGGIYLFDLWHENQRIRLKNLQYSYEIQMNRIAAQETEQLRRMLGFREQYPYKIIPALVVGQDMDRVVNALIVDRGSKDGVRKYMAVVTDDGLIGRIYEVYPTAASVQILRDTNSRISAMIEGERHVQGIVRWEGGTDLKMYTLEHTSNLTPGQRVYTTGVGGTYPEGLLIGVVNVGENSETGASESVKVTPVADFAGAHEVFILGGSEQSDIWDDGDGSGYFQRPEMQ
jgi:rod shape-determining protein MreC